MNNKIIKYLKEIFYLIFIPLFVSFFVNKITYKISRTQYPSSDPFNSMIVGFFVAFLSYAALTLFMIFLRIYKNKKARTNIDGGNDKSVSTKVILIIAVIPIITLISLYIIRSITTRIYLTQLISREINAGQTLNSEGCTFKRTGKKKGAIICKLNSTKEQTLRLQDPGLVFINTKKNPSVPKGSNCTTSINSINVNNSLDTKERLDLINLQKGTNILQMNFELLDTCVKYGIDYPIEYLNLSFAIYNPDSKLYQGYVRAIEKAEINEQ